MAELIIVLCLSSGVLGLAVGQFTLAIKSAEDMSKMHGYVIWFAILLFISGVASLIFGGQALDALQEKPKNVLVPYPVRVPAPAEAPVPTEALKP